MANRWKIPVVHNFLTNMELNSIFVKIFYKNLNKTSEPYLVYGGKANSSRNGIEIVGWKDIEFTIFHNNH